MADVFRLSGNALEYFQRILEIKASLSHSQRSLGRIEADTHLL
jgi:hypothetical protein